MCKIIDDYIKELVMENDIMNVKNFYKAGGTLELAILTFKSLPEEVVRKIYENDS